MPKRGLSVLWIGTVVILSGALSTSADLQNVRVSGELRIRGYWWNDSFNQGLLAPAVVSPEVRWPARCFPGRPIGDFLGGQTVMSYWDWDDRDADYRMVLQRTVLDVDAAFSDNVAACVSLDSVDTWGEDFRSNVWTGADTRAASIDDAEVYQAFIEADELAGLPLPRILLLFFLSPFFFPEKSPIIALLVPDWIKFSTELESQRGASFERHNQGANDLPGYHLHYNPGKKE